MGAAISVVDYIHALRQVGFTNDQSEVQARELERIVVAVTRDKEELRQSVKQEIKRDLELEGLATKRDLEELRLASKKDLEIVKKDLEIAIEKVRVEIQQVRYDALKFTVWTGVGVVVALGGMLAKGFHWF